jgi:hypothetical protein
LVRDYEEIQALFEGSKPAPKAEPRPLMREATNSTNGATRPTPSERPAASERPARPQLNRARSDAELPFDGDPPGGEPPPEEEEVEQDRPRPTAPAEREPAPVSATASKAASLRERFASRKP